MSNGNRPLITPMTAEQRKEEEALSNQLRDAELDAAKNILASAATPDGLLSVIENASGFAEATTQKFRHPDSPPVACTEGCYWCCYQAVPVTAPEAFRISKFLATELGSEGRAKAEANLSKLDKRTRGLTPKARAKLRVPCAFLQDGRCTVYAVRPLACAEFTSFNVQDCKRGQRIGFKPGSVIHEKARMVVFHAVQKGLTQGLRESLPTADTSPLELTAAVVCALNATQAAEEWLAGGKIFASAHLAGDRT